MKPCKQCGSYAINHHQYDRDGSDEDLCDAHYWQKRAIGLGEAKAVAYMTKRGAVYKGEFSRQTDTPLFTAPPDIDAKDIARRNFNAGISVALQTITSMDCGVTWREIVESVGVDEMIRYASIEEPEEWELAGFSKYAMTELRRRKKGIPK